MRDRVETVVHEMTGELSGERQRVLHVATKSVSFHALQVLMKYPGSGPDGSWERTGSTSDSLDDALAAGVLRDRHVFELRSLTREDTSYREGAGPRTKWGRSQSATQYATGVTSHSTAGHGGFKLSAGRNAKVHPALREAGGWYEEDSDWAVVAHTFPELFTTYERDVADKSLRNWKPDEYTQATGIEVTPEESSTLRDRAFASENAGNYVVLSAVYSSDHPGMTEVNATLGGKRPSYGEDWNDRKFLVPSAEYSAVPLGKFVVDLERHEEMLPASPSPGR